MIHGAKNAKLRQNRNKNCEIKWKYIKGKEKLHLHRTKSTKLGKNWAKMEKLLKNGTKFAVLCRNTAKQN